MKALQDSGLLVYGNDLKLPAELNRFVETQKQRLRHIPFTITILPRTLVAGMHLQISAAVCGSEESVLLRTWYQTTLVWTATGLSIILTALFSAETILTHSTLTTEKTFPRTEESHFILKTTITQRMTVQLYLSG